METYYSLGRIIVLVAVATNLAFLCIQIWAIRKHRRTCFMLLATGAIVATVYSALVGFPFFVPLSLASHILLQQIAVGLVLLASILGVWGMLLLVRSYRKPV